MSNRSRHRRKRQEKGWKEERELREAIQRNRVKLPTPDEMAGKGEFDIRIYDDRARKKAPEEL